MPRKKSKKSKKEKDNIAGIGEFVEEKEGFEDDYDPEIEEEKINNDEEKPENPPKDSGLNELDPQELKERIIHIVSEIGGRGLTDEEKERFIGDFSFWNGIIFEFLDIGNNLRSTLGGVKLKLTPVKATLLYLGGTAALVGLLRPDLLKKLVGKKKDIQSATPTPPPPDAEPEPETSEINNESNGEENTEAVG